MLEIHNAKLVLTLVDTETGEMITKEATFGEFKDKVSKPRASRSKKPVDEDPTPKLTLLEGKLQMNNAAVQLTGYEPEEKIDIKFEKKGKVSCPVMMRAESGNRLTKTYTISCRGSKHDNLAEYGNVFELLPYEGKNGYFKLKGDLEKEDDIIDVPEEINDPEEFDDINESSDDSGIDISDFNLEL